MVDVNEKTSDITCSFNRKQTQSTPINEVSTLLLIEYLVFAFVHVVSLAVDVFTSMKESSKTLLWTLIISSD